MEWKERARDAICNFPVGNFTSPRAFHGRLRKWSLLQLCSPQPGQLYTAALTVAKAVAHSSIMQKKDKKWELYNKMSRYLSENCRTFFFLFFLLLI